VSGSHTEAQLSTANILTECLMLRDNLYLLIFLRQDIVDLVSHLCGVALIFLILLLLRFYATLFYIALSILSVLYCVYDFIINK